MFLEDLQSGFRPPSPVKLLHLLKIFNIGLILTPAVKLLQSLKIFNKGSNNDDDDGGGDDDDAWPIVVAVRGKAPAFAVYIYVYLYIYSKIPLS